MSSRTRQVLLGVAVGLAAALALILTVLVNGRKTVDPLASGLLQFFFVLVGILASYAWGKLSVQIAAEDLVKKDARKAVRRIVGLSRTTQTFSAVIDEHRQALVARGDAGAEPADVDDLMRTLTTLDHFVLSQLQQAQDAIEDWRDVVPEAVDAVEARSREMRTDA